jgi:hypothetical protein
MFTDIFFICRTLSLRGLIAASIVLTQHKEYVRIGKAQIPMRCASPIVTVYISPIGFSEVTGNGNMFNTR